MKECLNEILELINKYGYEDFSKALFVEMLGVEDRIEQPQLISAIDDLYEWYINHDYFSSPMSEHLYDKFWEVYIDPEDEV